VLFDPAKGITDIQGTILYIAPEVLNQKAVYNERSDMWSIGIVVYSMLLGVFPFSVDQQE
jgi:MAP/microtubule affinity-regulating kinase